MCDDQTSSRLVSSNHKSVVAGNFSLSIVRPMKLELQFLAQNSGKMMRAGGYYSLFITAENC